MTATAAAGDLTRLPDAVRAELRRTFHKPFDVPVIVGVVVRYVLSIRLAPPPEAQASTSGPGQVR